MKFNCWKTCGPLLRGRVRLLLESAKTAGRCDKYTETKSFLFSYFYVTGADEGLARQLAGSPYVDGLIARSNQQQACRMGFPRVGL